MNQTSKAGRRREHMAREFSSEVDASLHDRLIVFIEESVLELQGKLQDDTPLLESGLFDSLALLSLAQWIETETNTSMDLTAFDLIKEWNTVRDIINFVREHRR